LLFSKPERLGRDVNYSSSFACPSVLTLFPSPKG